MVMAIALYELINEIKKHNQDKKTFMSYSRLKLQSISIIKNSSITYSLEWHFREFDGEILLLKTWLKLTPYQIALPLVALSALLVAALTLLPAIAQAQTPPAAPTGLTATAGDGGVTLSWNNPGDSTITGYEYQVNHNDTGTGNLSGWGAWQSIGGNADTTSYTINGLTNGREYRYRLRAVNASGAGQQAPNTHPWFVVATPQGLAPEPTPTPEPTATPTPTSTPTPTPTPEPTATPTPEPTATPTPTSTSTPTPTPEPTATPTPTPTSTPTPVTQPPAAPAGLTAIAGDGSVTLTWNDPQNASIT